MRPTAAVLLLLLLVPTALAAVEYQHTYIVYGYGCSSGGLMRNCAWYSPPLGATNVTATASDISGESVRVRVCHEWTYDEGWHATVRCDVGCDSVTSPLSFPTRSGVYYRVNVELRGGPGPCETAATAGELRTIFS